MDDEDIVKTKKAIYKRWWFWLALFVISIGLILFALVNSKFWQSKQGQGNIIDNLKQAAQPESREEPRIKSIGFNLDYYDPATNKAGEIVFKKFAPPYEKVWVDYGQKLLAQYSADRRDSYNVHPSIRLPAGTKLQATVDGVVASVTELYSKDYSIQITADGTMKGIIFGLEHIQNPTVKAGDKVKAGDFIAEVTDVTSDYHPGFGYFDLTVFRGSANGPEHLCPFQYLDDSIKEEVYAKIRALYESWEEYIGDKNAYDEENYPVPGCVITDPIAG